MTRSREKWFTGLRRFLTGDYKGALTSFGEANRLQPEFPDVKRMLAEATDKVKNPPPVIIDVRAPLTYAMSHSDPSATPNPTYWDM